MYPAWSPEGRHVAFLRDAEEGWEVNVVPVLGGVERRVGAASSFRGLAWSPDGESLVIIDRDSPEEPEGLYALSLETGEKRRITMPPGRFDGRFPRDGRPAISPDGQWIAFRRSQRQGHQDVYRVPFGGGDVDRLTFDDVHVQSMDWTPDGRTIIFSSNRNGERSLWRIPTDGGEPVRVSPHASGVFGLVSVSRRGRRLAYGQAKRNLNIWRMSGPSAPVSSSPSRFIASTWWDSQPSYSPDGKWIAFVSQRSGYPELWVSGADASEPIRLTSFEQPNGHRLHPQWSPDGREIVFQSSKEGAWDIFVVERDGGELRRLTRGAFEEVHPSWSRDGRWIYFGSNRSGEFQIWRMPGEGGIPEQVTRRGGFEAYESFDGTSLYYVKPDSTSPYKPTASRGIWHVPVEAGDETQVLEMGHRGSWALMENGICFVETEDPQNAPVSFYSFETGAVRSLGSIDGQVTSDVHGFSVTPDGRWIAYARADVVVSDIMMVENFR
jgi:Tol biopolymer transport system component